MTLLPPVKPKKKKVVTSQVRRPAMRLVGAELEFGRSGPENLEQMRIIVHDIAQRQGMQCVSNEVADHWTMKTDHCGYELTTPAFVANNENFMKVRQIVEDLRREVLYRRQVANAPRETGFHVHVDIRDLNSDQLKNLINLFRTFEPALQDIQHPRRRENNWCRTLSSYFEGREGATHRERIETLSTSNINLLRDHYAAMNFGRYSEQRNGRKTIEIRYGAASVRGRKVINWMQVLTFLVEASKVVENYQYNTCGSLEDFCEFMMNIETGTWLDRRRRNLVTWMKRRHQQLYHRREWRAEREARRAAETNIVVDEAPEVA